MKTILLSLFATLTLATVTAQYTQNFEGAESGLTGNCWTLADVYKTTTSGEVITGTGSLYTNPPTSGSGTRDIITPALNITSTTFTVSFKYKVTSRISGNATRTIEVGLVDNAGSFTSLHSISMDKNSPVSVQNFNQTFTLSTIGVRKLVFKLGGSTGDGNSRLIFDDLFASANPYYGPASNCNSAPVAVNDMFSGTTGSVITGNLLTNDIEPNGESITSSVVVTSVDGIVLLNQNGSFTFTPNPGFTGTTTTFTYQLSDNGFSPLSSNIATVTLNFASAIILPVKLVSFSAMLNSDRVDLKWTTASEKNVNHFAIEKSLDGINYTEAGIVLAKGNTTETAIYAFTDKNIEILQAGVVYYRLRSVDVDGKTELSQVRSIRIGKKPEQGLSILTYPNPVSAELRITIPASWQGKKVSYELFTNNGQVARKKLAAMSGQTETMNLNNLSPGLYIVKVSCNGETAQQKIIMN